MVITIRFIDHVATRVVDVDVEIIRPLNPTRRESTGLCALGIDIGELTLYFGEYRKGNLPFELRDIPLEKLLFEKLLLADSTHTLEFLTKILGDAPYLEFNVKSVWDAFEPFRENPKAIYFS
ncbi:MAG: hypothetical protein ACRCTP_04060 [Aeromonas popoffii]|uniref:hypothetical protein n=1 Tax=Aeromonas popoffii TaxID=70856 RepID=UPI003F3AD60F